MVWLAGNLKLEVTNYSRKLCSLGGVAHLSSSDDDDDDDDGEEEDSEATYIYRLRKRRHH